MSPTISRTDALRAARAEIERRVRAGEPSRVDNLGEEFPEVWCDAEAALELVYAEYVVRTEVGPTPDRGEWYRRFPQWRDRLERLFGLHDLLAQHPTIPGQVAETWAPDNSPVATDLLDIDPEGYTLLAEIGRGGMGIVYRARQHALNRIVAVKILREEFAAPADDGLRLLREAELVGRLQHPNIVQVYHVGTRDGLPYLAMEFVDGAGLDQALARLQVQRSAGVSARRGAELVETLALAMHYAHEQGVIHLDLKPANVLIPGKDGAALAALVDDSWSPSGVKIVDFGLAMVPEIARENAPTLTVAGTPCYMAPEQADAKRAALGPATDVYALGGILYELLTHRPPFQGGTVLETLDLVRTKEPVAPRQLRPQLPRDLETICLKCLHKEPGRRYASANALAEDLRRFREGSPIAARPISSMERAVKWVKRHPAVSALSFALIAALTAGIVLQTARRRDSEQARVREQQLYYDAQRQLASKVTASARAVWNAGMVDEARQTLMECPDEFRDAEWQSLHPLFFAEIASLSVPEASGTLLAVSPDGNRFAYCHRGGGMQVRIVDAAGGDLVESLDFGAVPYLIEFTSDGRGLVAVASKSTKLPNRIQSMAGAADPTRSILPTDASLRFFVWDFAEKAMTRRWSSPEHPMAAISPSGRRIAAGHSEQLRVWDTATGELVAELPGPFAAGRYAVGWDGQDELLAVRLKSEIQIWNVEKREIVGTIRVAAFETGGLEKAMPIFANVVDPVYLRPDGRVVIAAPAPERAGTMPSIRPLVAWEVKTGGEAWRITTKGLSTRVSISPNGRRMAVARDNDIELHDAHHGTPVATLRGHRSSLAALRFSSDGRRLYSLSIDKTIRTWDVSPWID